MKTDIEKYHAAQNACNRAICEKLFAIVSKEIPTAENKIWHGAPVWFLEDNPIVGYFVRKEGVQQGKLIKIGNW